MYTCDLVAVFSYLDIRIVLRLYCDCQVEHSQ
jgi:hypothetical protein